MTFLNGSTAKIYWTLQPGVSTVSTIRTWFFQRSAGHGAELLAEISRAGALTIFTKLYEIDVEEPAALVLKNVNASYNGTYEFSFSSSKLYVSKVDVFIASM